MTTDMRMTVKDERYEAEDGSTLKREYGFTENGNKLNGAWVYRDAAGVMIDHDRYRNDLSGRYKLNLKES